MATRSVCINTAVVLMLGTVAAIALLTVFCMMFTCCAVLYCTDTTDTTAAVTSASPTAATYEGTYNDAIYHILF
jgi:hypothetical protein